MFNRSCGNETTNSKGAPVAAYIVVSNQICWWSFISEKSLPCPNFFQLFDIILKFGKGKRREVGQNSSRAKQAFLQFSLPTLLMLRLVKMYAQRNYGYYMKNVNY